MRIFLAPMEGILDKGLRNIIAAAGGIDICVSEFIRITNQLLPEKVFLRIAPELENQSKTKSGVYTRPQLLGSDPICLAENAARLAQLNPYGIDLNFGCPAKTVNRHRGGAVLLDEPELIYSIIKEVRKSVPKNIIVSAKMRLGNNDTTKMLEVASSIELGGANELTVHARTKAQGYKPPVYWEQIARIKERAKINIIANGDINTVNDAINCRKITACDDLMIGRALIAAPNLANDIKTAINNIPAKKLPWEDVKIMLQAFWQDIITRVEKRHQAGRVKLWLSYLRRIYPEAEIAFNELRTTNNADDIEKWIYK